MPDCGELSIEHVESLAERDGRTTAVCVVRCLAGAVRPGVMLVPDAGGEGLRLEWIRRYGRDVDLLDPPHNAMVALSAPGPLELVKGSRLTATG